MVFSIDGWHDDETGNFDTFSAHYHWSHMYWSPMPPSLTQLELISTEADRSIIAKSTGKQLLLRELMAELDNNM
eukprot:80469-Pyramimonas_sp.AAC.1